MRASSTESLEMTIEISKVQLDVLGEFGLYGHMRMFAHDGETSALFSLKNVFLYRNHTRNREYVSMMTFPGEANCSGDISTIWLALSDEAFEELGIGGFTGDRLGAGGGSRVDIYVTELYEPYKALDKL